MTPAEAAAIRTALAAWYERAQRDLPWRRTRDPYAVLVSELMLQQTRVTTALPYYHRFLERFPTVQALAAAYLVSTQTVDLPEVETTPSVQL